MITDAERYHSNLTTRDRMSALQNLHDVQNNTSKNVKPQEPQCNCFLKFQLVEHGRRGFDGLARIFYVNVQTLERANWQTC